jgi:hypothetical protein
MRAAPQETCSTPIWYRLSRESVCGIHPERWGCDALDHRSGWCRLAFLIGGAIVRRPPNQGRNHKVNRTTACDPQEARASSPTFSDLDGAATASTSTFPSPCFMDVAAGFDELVDRLEGPYPKALVAAPMEETQPLARLRPLGCTHAA